MKAVALATVLVLLAPMAPAEPAGDPAACTVPADPEANPLGDRSGTIARYEQLSTDCLKQVVLECGRVANRVILDVGSAAICSYGYEALLRRGFGGDFRALVAWWHSARDDSLQ